MARQKQFGEILREARERKGMDLQTAARQLRIRPDILKAIEASDYNRMPPRAYARNMVSSYARMVGLNPTDMTRMYLDDSYAHQVGQSRETAPQSIGTRSREGRILYDSRNERSRSSSYEQGGSSRRTESAPSTRYTNLYSGPKAPVFQRSRLPFIVIGAVVVVALVAVIALLAFGGDKGDSAGDKDNMGPVAGFTDTSNPDTGEVDPTVMQNNQAIVVTPDRVTFVYAVPSGSSAYIEVYEKEGGAPTVAQTVTGPSEKSFDVTETLTFVTTNPSNVIITVGNKVVEPTDENGDSVYLYEVDFDEYLAEWKKNNLPESTASGSDA